MNIGIKSFKSPLQNTYSFNIINLDYNVKLFQPSFRCFVRKSHFFRHRLFNTAHCLAHYWNNMLVMNTNYTLWYGNRFLSKWFWWFLWWKCKPTPITIPKYTAASRSVKDLSGFSAINVLINNLMRWKNLKYELFY